jgi:hypothetical protein
MTPIQQKLLDHWIKYAPLHKQYIEDAVRRHFEAAPWDREVLRPILLQHWRKNE